MEGTENPHDQNVNAFDENGNVVFIGDVPRGKKGYFCMGCRRELQAVKPKSFKLNGTERKAFFRHHPYDVKIGGKCTIWPDNEIKAALKIPHNEHG